ncbi:MAG: HAD hydrolase-like protein [Gemmatimonadetes bacterium]|nr:HAD hydrolase-like protein [Gemmatimonadota bacterium]
MISTVLFDFDGTLVHTAPGILAGFRKTLSMAGVEPIEKIDERVIGPPLLATLTRLTGIAPGSDLDRLASAFKATYDADGILGAEPYPGLVEMFDALERAGRRSFVVTNKRHVPARAIAERLGIATRLAGLYSLDSLTPPAPRKQAVVARLLADHGIAAASAIFVGDSAEDAEAAAGNGLRFVAAGYGYGSPLGVADAPAAGALNSLADLPDLLHRLD